MPRRVRFTEEEKEEDIKDVEAMLRDNPNCHEIAAELGRSVQYICDIKDYLDKQGILTKEELEQIALEKIDEKNRKFDKEVLELIKLGKNKNQIHLILKADYRKVTKSYARLSEVLDLSGYLTEEELLELERLKKIKDFVDDGTGAKYIAQIAKATDIPDKTVERLVQKLIDNKSIKKENIINNFDEKKELTRKRNEEIYALKDTIPIESIAEKYQLTISSVQRIIREQEEGPSKPGEKSEQIRKRNEEIYTLSDNKVPISEIAQKFGLFPDSIKRIIRKRGKQSPQKNDKTGKNEELKEPDDSLSLLEKNILEYLKKGLSYNYICKKEDLLQNDLMKIVTSLKERKYITQIIINESRETRRNYYFDTIERLLRDGNFPSEIYNKINQDGEELTISGINKLIQKLIDNGRIAKEEIERARDEQEKAIDSIVSPLIRKGYTVKEIVDTDKNLTDSQVISSRKRVIASENIAKEQLEKWRKKRERQKQNEVYRKDEKIIWGYVENYGYDDKDIAPLIDAGVQYVGNRRRAYQKRKGISDEKFKLIKAQGRLKRKQREEQEKNKLLENFCWIKDLYKKEYESSLPKLTTKQRYFEQFKQVTELSIYSYTKEDVDILSFIVLYEEEYLTDENIKYVMEKYLSIGEEAQAMRLLNSYINGDDKPIVNDAIIEMRITIQNYKQGTN